MSNVEENLKLDLDFTKIRKIAEGSKDVIPAVVQDIDSREVLILGYVNRQALEEAIKRKVVVLWSTSRNELWIKGQTSKQTLELVEIRVNCEQNSILYLAKAPEQGACHTKDSDGRFRESCYYRTVENMSDLLFRD